MLFLRTNISKHFTTVVTDSDIIYYTCTQFTSAGHQGITQCLLRKIYKNLYNYLIFLAKQINRRNDLSFLRYYCSCILKTTMKAIIMQTVFNDMCYVIEYFIVDFPPSSLCLIGKIRNKNDIYT